MTQSNQNQLAEIQKLMKDLDLQKHYKDHLTASNQTVAQLEGRVKQLEAQLADAQNHILILSETDLKSYKEKLRKAVNDVANLQGQVHHKEADLDQYKVKVGELLEELERVNKERFGLDREVEKLKKEIVDLKRQIASLKSKGRYKTVSFLGWY